jgi:hypothetical protein
MSSPEDEEYQFEDWIEDLKEARDSLGFPGCLLILLVFGFAFGVVWYALSFVPPGRYPRIVLSLFMVPTLPIIWVFYQVVGRLIHRFFIKGTSRPR